MIMFRLRLLILGILLLGRPMLAAPLEVGGEIPKLSAQDQHGVAYTFTNGTAFLLIAMDMDSAKAANQKLATEGAGFLEKHNAVYLMDVHTMPAVGQFFALRKMRKYPQRIVLIETADTMNWVPVKTNHITVLKLTPEGRIQKISYWQPTKSPGSELFPETQRLFRSFQTARQ